MVSKAFFRISTLSTPDDEGGLCLSLSVSTLLTPGSELRVASFRVPTHCVSQDLQPPHVSRAIEHMASCCAQLLPVTRLQQEAVRQQLAKLPSGRLQLSFKRRTGRSASPAEGTLPSCWACNLHRGSGHHESSDGKDP